MSDVAPRGGTELGVSKRSGRDKSGPYANYVFGIMFAISFLNFMDRNVFSAAANTIATELHLGIDQIGFIAFGFTIVNMLGALPLGVWADRAKRKNVVDSTLAGG
jgi:MFS transporter, Spinster family, sphingosine-1-phosphate transporter